jgi:hypothetical protein
MTASRQAQSIRVDEDWFMTTRLFEEVKEDQRPNVEGKCLCCLPVTTRGSISAATQARSGLAHEDRSMVRFPRDGKPGIGWTVGADPRLPLSK